MKTVTSIHHVTAILAGLTLFASVTVADVVTDVGVGLEGFGYPSIDGLDADQQPPQWALDQTLNGRINWRSFPEDRLELSVQYELGQRWRLAQDDGSTEFSLPAPMGATYRWQDLDDVLFEDDPVKVIQNLDRLSLNYAADAGDLILGRQAISLGLSPQFSPVDIVMPASLAVQNRRYRPGVDAARWRQPIGPVGEFDAGWVVGDDQLLFARVANQVDRVDLEFTAFTANTENYLVGVGAYTPVGNWSLWQEMAWLGNDDENGVRLTLGADRQVLGDVYVVGEYHYNGLGAEGDYSQILSSELYRLGMVTPWGRHYLALQASKPINPLLTGQLGTTVNLVDGGALLNGSLQRSLTDNSELNVTALVPVAEGPDSDGFQSEFGVYPTMVTLAWSTVF